MSHPAYAIRGRIYCMGKNQEIRIILIFFINRPKVGIHFWTDTGTGRKEKFCNIYFALYIMIGYSFAILVQKRKGLYPAQHRQTDLTITRDDFCKRKVKHKNQGKKEQGIKPDFLRHKCKITPLIR